MNEYPSITSCPIDKTRVDWLQYCDRGRFIPILYASLTGGLCNRILGLSSLQSKATTESRLVKTYWPLNGQDGCSSLWSDVFTTPIQSFSEWDLYWIMDVAHEVCWYHRPEDAYVRRDSTNIVVVKSSYDYFAPQSGVNLSGEFSLSANKRWCLDLQIKANIIEKVKRFCLPQGVLGVHLRVHENHFADNTLFSTNPLTSETMDRMSQWPGKVLIISNSLEYKLRVRSYFGSKILVQEVESYNRDSLGATSAIIDAILMAMCKERIGNWSSTLYRLACYWSSRPDFQQMLA